MAIQSYNDEVNVKNELKLRELLLQLPVFCKQFFISIESRTQSRTRIAYAYDLIVFFDYLKNNNPILSNIKMQDIPISILDQITTIDIEEYLFYLKNYDKDGIIHTNDERGIKRKMSAIRTF